MSDDNRWGMSHEEYTEVNRYTQQDYDQLEVDLAALREIVRALVEADDAGLTLTQDNKGDEWFVCAHCDNHQQTFHDFQHTPDCPIMLGRAALAKVEAR